MKYATLIWLIYVFSKIVSFSYENSRKIKRTARSGTFGPKGLKMNQWNIKLWVLIDKVTRYSTTFGQGKMINESGKSQAILFPE